MHGNKHYIVEENGVLCRNSRRSVSCVCYSDRYVEGHYLSGDDIHSEASGINKLTGADAHAWVEVYFDGVGWLPLQQMIGMPEQASKNAALEDPSFEANQVASGYSLPWDSGDRKNPGL